MCVYIFSFVCFFFFFSFMIDSSIVQFTGLTVDENDLFFFSPAFDTIIIIIYPYT